MHVLFRQGREELGAVQAVDATHDLATFFRSVGKLAKANSVWAQKGRLMFEGLVHVAVQTLCVLNHKS